MVWSGHAFSASYLTHSRFSTGCVRKKEGQIMRRTMLLLASMALTLLLASGLALAVNKVGNQGRDFLKGTDKADNLIGQGETDLIFGLAGDDNLLGGSGKDIVQGGTFERSLGGNKNLLGGEGNDVVFGGKGSDRVVGEEGNDILIDGNEPNPVRDTLSGGDGNDVFFVWNDPAGKDVVACGDGLDRVFADRADALADDCEKVFVGESKIDAFFGSIPQSFWDGLAPPWGPQYPSEPEDYAKAQGLAKAFQKANTNPLVGDWRRNLRCEEYVRRMKQAGLADMLADNPCQGWKVHQHDHIFYRDGLFRSVDNHPDYFVDEDHYILPNDHTIVFPGSGSETIPPVTAHFRFSDHLNTVTFDLVVPKNLDECSERCQETYEWAVSVFYSGLPWHRVCQADDDDNNVLGRTDELGEPCWVDPMEIENRLD
jgi:hypothetical protein